MKRYLFTLLFCLSSFIIGTTALADRAIKVVTDLDHKKGKIGTYRALIIGIQNYNDPKISDLGTPLNDALEMTDVLKNYYGFQVKTLLDKKATKKNIYNHLRDLTNKTKPNDSVLIYYAGHGDIDRTFNDGWWIPVDAIGGDPFTYLDNSQIQKTMASIKAKHVLLISDSCYSGTLFGQARAMPKVINDKYYLNLYNEKSRWGITSGNKTPVSDTGSENHSVFAYQLLKKLKKNTKPYLSTQEIYTYIAPVIANNSEQQPLCRPIRGTGDMGGEFIFVSTKTNAILETKLEPTVNETLEKEKAQLAEQKLELARKIQELEKEKLEQEKVKLELELEKLAQEKKQMDEKKETIQQEKLEQNPNQKALQLASIHRSDPNVKVVDKDEHFVL
ncbi:MAG: caspase family protein, partial [Desulfobacteraceae bacterium]|nr:caspase family protein [Desulfobacteraceae bacterium]